MSDIPTARRIIDEVAKGEIDPDRQRELKRALALMVRTHNGRHAGAVSNPITPVVKAAIEDALRADPKAGFDVIARRFRVNAGRISEIHAQMT